MDVVYVLGPGSPWDNNELRYSLRSLEKYVTGWRDVYVVGECPAWLKGVIHLPFPHKPGQKEKNIMQKIAFACQVPGLSSEFLHVHDDHFAIQPQSANVPAWAWKSLEDLRKAHKALDGYVFQVSNTIEALDNAGKSAHHFDVHTPIVYDKERFPLAMIQYNWDVSRGYVVKSLYGNTVGLEPVQLPDLKLNRPHSLVELVALVKGRPWWSIGNRVLSEQVKELLQALYPEKSRFEV